MSGGVWKSFSSYIEVYHKGKFTMDSFTTASFGKGQVHDSQFLNGFFHKLNYITLKLCINQIALIMKYINKKLHNK